MLKLSKRQWKRKRKRGKKKVDRREDTCNKAWIDNKQGEERDRQRDMKRKWMRQGIKSRKER